MMKPIIIKLETRDMTLDELIENLNTPTTERFQSLEGFAVIYLEEDHTAVEIWCACFNA